MKSLLTIGAAVLTACVDAAVIEVKPCAGNATPAVAAGLARLRDGDTLRFAAGEYHFHEKGAKNEFLASVGDSVVCFRTDTIVKLHVHTFTPEKVFEYCRAFGEFVAVKVENMSVQHSETSVDEPEDEPDYED